MTHIIEIRPNGIATHSNTNPENHNMSDDVEVEIFDDRDAFEVRLSELEAE